MSKTHRLTLNFVKQRATFPREKNLNYDLMIQNLLKKIQKLTI